MNKSSLISDLLKSPSQIRAEEQEALRQKGLQRAALVRGSGGAGASLFGGMFRDFAAQQAAQVDKRTQQVIQGLGGAAGMDMRSAAEKQAAMQQDQMSLVQGADNLTRMKAVKGRLEAQNADPRIIEMINQRMEAERAKISQRAADTRAEVRAEAQLSLANKRFGLEEADLALKKAKQEADLALGKSLGEFDMTTPEGVDGAVSLLLSKNKLAEATSLKRAYAENQGAMETAIQFFANNYTGGDMEEAFDMYVKAKREGTGEKLAFNTLEEDYEKAKGKARSMTTAFEALDILESGRVITGSFASTRKGAEKLYQSVLNGLGIGVDEDEAVQRTELLLSQTFKLAGQMLSSGMFGTGTSITQRDLETAQEISGASATLTPEGMAKILEINARMQETQIMSYNKGLDRYKDEFWASSPIGKEGYIIEIPERKDKSKVGVDVLTRDYEQVAQDEEGNKIYLLNGRWYDSNGDQVK